MSGWSPRLKTGDSWVWATPGYARCGGVEITCSLPPLGARLHSAPSTCLPPCGAAGGGRDLPAAVLWADDPARLCRELLKRIRSRMDDRAQAGMAADRVRPLGLVQPLPGGSSVVPACQMDGRVCLVETPSPRCSVLAGIACSSQSQPCARGRALFFLPPTPCRCPLLLPLLLPPRRRCGFRWPATAGATTSAALAQRRREGRSWRRRWVTEGVCVQAVPGALGGATACTMPGWCLARQQGPPRLLHSSRRALAPGRGAGAPGQSCSHAGCPKWAAFSPPNHLSSRLPAGAPRLRGVLPHPLLGGAVLHHRHPACSPS